MTEPTAADRAKAAEIIGRRWLIDGVDAEVDTNALVLDFAAALADARAEADQLRDAMRALAEEWELAAHDEEASRAVAIWECAARVRDLADGGRR